MKIAINSLAHAGGGGITYLKNMLPRFADDDDEYVVLVPAGRNALSKPSSGDIRFETVDILGDLLPARLLYEQAILPVRLQQWDIDILFSPADLTPLATSVPTLLAVRNPNPYFSASEYGLQRPPSRRLKFLVQRHLTKLSAKRADHVFFVSDFSREISNRFFDLPDSKISTVHHGIEHDLFEEPQEPADETLKRTVDNRSPYLLTVSTLMEHKNYEVLLRGYARLDPALRRQYPLVIAGRAPSPEYKEHLEGILTEEGLENNVVFLGGVDYENIPYLYTQASVYVLPSKLETFGHTLVEAMASGVPVIAADSTCIPEITDGAATLFDPDDPATLAERVTETLEDDGKRQELVAAGERRSENFSWDATFEETKALLGRVARE